MTIHVERYHICHRCNTKVSLKPSLTERLQLSYFGAKKDEYYNVNKEVLCSDCSEEFLTWIKGE